MERQPHQPEGGINSYGTDDPEQQARIERARIEGTRQRERDRARLEWYVEDGQSPDDAEALIDVQHSLRTQRGEQNPGAPNPEPARGAEAAVHSRPRIYVASLSDYNAGESHGAWIDADQDRDALAGDIDRMLAGAPTPGAEEYAIHDYDGFFGIQLHEYENLDTVSRLARGIAHHGAAFAVLAQHKGLDDLDAVDQAIRNGYHGVCTSIEDFVDDIAEDMDVEHLIDSLPENYRPYVTFDRKRLTDEVKARFLFLEGANGTLHVFDGTVI